MSQIDYIFEVVTSFLMSNQELVLTVVHIWIEMLHLFIYQKMSIFLFLRVSLHTNVLSFFSRLTPHSILVP